MKLPACTLWSQLIITDSIIPKGAEYYIIQEKNISCFFYNKNCPLSLTFWIFMLDVSRTKTQNRTPKTKDPVV